MNTDRNSSKDDSRVLIENIKQVLEDAKVKVYVDENNDKVSYIEYTSSKGVREFQYLNKKIVGIDLQKQYTKLTGSDEKVIPKIYEVLYEMADEAIYNNRVVSPLSRIGGNKKCTVYFLANSKHELVGINKDGIKKHKSNKRYKFLATSNTLPQVMSDEPSDESLLEMLSPFLNMDDEMKVLFCTNLVQEFLCGRSHFCNIISSEKGSGKTTLTNLWRDIIDPAKAKNIILPKREDNLVTHLSNHLIACFDNTSPLTAEISDLLCGAVTGTSYIKRKLYTDNDETVLSLHNIIIINGINIIPKKSDLLQRSLLFKLNAIPQEERKTDAELKKAFKDKLPYIITGIFNVLVEYFKIKDSVEITGTHRMAEAYNDCFIIAKVMGVEAEFVEAFENNQRLLSDDYIESNPTISAVVRFMKQRSTDSIQLPVSALYNRIKGCCEGHYFPKTASTFSRELSSNKDLLEKAGFEMFTVRTRECTQMTIKKIRKEEE